MSNLSERNRERGGFVAETPLVRHIPCQKFATASEEQMTAVLLKGLRGRGDGPWFIYTNILIKGPHGGRLEVDQLVVGPSGVFVVEVKHWDEPFIKQYPNVVEDELQKLEMKAKIVSGSVKRLDPGQWVSGVMLLTKATGKMPGVRSRYPQVYSQADWREALAVDASGRMNAATINAMARELGGPLATMAHGTLRRFGAVVNLELISPPEDAFHRVYKGVHQTKREKRIVHSYDLSASTHKDPLRLAEREWAAMEELAKYPFVPIVVDSFQPVANYAGEIYFFSLVAPDAPTLADRQADDNWLVVDRLQFALRCAEALAAMHDGGHSGQPVLHRRLSPSSILVRGGNQPIFTGFQWARLEETATIAVGADPLVSDPWMAPEVLAGGLGRASAESDVFSLCESLKTLFEGQSEEEASIRRCLDAGTSENAPDRCTARDLAEMLRGLVLAAPPLAVDSSDKREGSAATVPRLWAAEEEIVTDKGERYLVLSVLGRGANGSSYKVVEVRNGEQHGPFVAKIMPDRAMGTLAIEAYRRVRPYSLVPSLASVHEVAGSWDPNQPVAVLQWVEGAPLQSYQGIIELHAAEVGVSQDELLWAWLDDLCQALAALHRVGYVHGDVSLSNIIVQGRHVVLTDYDTVVRSGEKPVAVTAGLWPPGAGELADVSYDMYALGVSLFQAMFEPAPSRPLYAADGGLNWDAVDESAWARAAAFVRRATDLDAARRFRDADDGLRFLREVEVVPDSPLAYQSFGWHTAPRLLELLSLYPGSRHGNAETRGLDSAFAESTYIETELDRVLRDDIQRGELNLVVLLGNAGDGKTALLQHLIQGLGLTPPRSADRIWKQALPDGRELMINLDGSASYREKTSAELLDELFEPFHDQAFSPHRVRLVAINSGPLRAWLERFANGEDTWLTRQLRAALLGQVELPDPRIRILDLNQRSLVGSFQDGVMRAGFLDEMIDVLVDGDADSSMDPWASCHTCNARSWCSPYDSVRTLRDSVKGPLVRRRLAQALQAVHHRGTVHITTRELRATVSYVLFGTDTCQEIHELAESPVRSFATRAFDPESPHRQGEVLAELALLDPALVAEPDVDRELLTRGSGSNLELLRRASYFLDDPGAAGLVGGAHLDLFRAVGHMSSDQTEALCNRLVRGLSALDDLPQIALEQRGGVSLRVPARTATESVFWVQKPYEGFSLSVSRFNPRGVPTLHTEVSLTYDYGGGRYEHLAMGLELFSLLLDVEAGFRPGFDLRSADTHARLSIFAQRLAQEQRRHYFAWNPSDSRQVYTVDVDRVEEGGKVHQVLSVRPRDESRHG